MKEIKIPESDKYFANIFFIGGFAFFSFVGGVVLESVKISNLSLFNMGTSLLVAIAFVLGIVSLAIGWYTLGYRELSRYGRN